MVSGSRAALAKAVGGSDDQPSASLQCVVDVVTTTAHDKGVVQPRVPMACDPTARDSQPQSGVSPDGEAPKKTPSEITFQGRRYRWDVPARVAHYPGGYIDDLIYMGIPRELWPFPVDGETKDETTDADCGYKHDEDGN